MTDLSSSPDLKAIQARVDATTPGEWYVGLNWVYTEPLSGVDTDPLLRVDTVPENGTFIVNARSDVRVLLALVPELQAKRDVLIDQVAGRDATIQRVRDYVAELRSDRTSRFYAIGRELKAILDGDPADDGSRTDG